MSRRTGAGNASLLFFPDAAGKKIQIREKGVL
ncbi:hypothetical protein CK3_29270 [butyrate-producing bacterium SS3/4]|nr:hypothetical protein CK3_29270 [butyrate-producing bacterium SS3/4]